MFRSKWTIIKYFSFVWKLRIQLTNLNLNHFKMVKAMLLKIIALRYPWMASPAYQVSWKSIGSKVIGGGQTGRDIQTPRLVIW
jgi:hypothetical protein